MMQTQRTINKTSSQCAKKQQLLHRHGGGLCDPKPNHQRQTAHSRKRSFQTATHSTNVLKGKAGPTALTSFMEENDHHRQTHRQASGLTGSSAGDHWPVGIHKGSRVAHHTLGTSEQAFHMLFPTPVGYAVPWPLML